MYEYVCALDKIWNQKTRSQTQSHIKLLLTKCSLYTFKAFFSTTIEQLVAYNESPSDLLPGRGRTEKPDEFDCQINIHPNPLMESQHVDLFQRSES